MRTRGSRRLGRVTVLTFRYFALPAVFATVAVAQENGDGYTGDVAGAVLAEELAVTGADTGTVLGTALALLAVGTGLVLLARRQREARHAGTS